MVCCIASSKMARLTDLIAVERGGHTAPDELHEEVRAVLDADLWSDNEVIAAIHAVCSLHLVHGLTLFIAANSLTTSSCMHQAVTTNTQEAVASSSGLH